MQSETGRALNAFTPHTVFQQLTTGLTGDQQRRFGFRPVPCAQANCSTCSFKMQSDHLRRTRWWVPGVELPLRRAGAQASHISDGNRCGVRTAAQPPKYATQEQRINTKTPFSFLFQAHVRCWSAAVLMRGAHTPHTEGTGPILTQKPCSLSSPHRTPTSPPHPHQLLPNSD